MKMSDVFDRRLFKRALDEFPVEITPEKKMTVCIIGESCNISANGACLYIEKDKNGDILKMNDKLKLVFNIPFSLSHLIPFRTIISRAQIKRIREIDRHEKKFLELGVKFIDDVKVTSIV